MERLVGWLGPFRLNRLRWLYVVGYPEDGMVSESGGGGGGGINGGGMVSGGGGGGEDGPFMYVVS